MKYFLNPKNTRILQMDAFFLQWLAGSTLSELHSSFVLAEIEREGGVSPHVGPFVDFSDVGSLLSAAEFQLMNMCYVKNHNSCHFF